MNDLEAPSGPDAGRTAALFQPDPDEAVRLEALLRRDHAVTTLLAETLDEFVASLVGGTVSVAFIASGIPDEVRQAVEEAANRAAVPVVRLSDGAAGGV